MTWTAPEGNLHSGQFIGGPRRPGRRSDPHPGFVYGHPGAKVIDCLPVVGANAAVQSVARALVSPRVPPTLDAYRARQALAARLESADSWGGCAGRFLGQAGANVSVTLATSSEHIRTIRGSCRLW
jgi:hypothetical protein